MYILIMSSSGIDKQINDYLIIAQKTDGKKEKKRRNRLEEDRKLQFRYLLL